MTADGPGATNGGYALLNALDRFRDDVREDLQSLRVDARSDLVSLEGRLMGAIADNRRQLTEYATVHGAEHASMVHEREAATAEMKTSHARYDAFLKSAEVAQAHRDGALGVVRYILDVLGSNGGGLLRVGIGIAASLLALSGNVHIDLGTR